MGRPSPGDAAEAGAPVRRCPRPAPVFYGRLDDAVWQVARPVELHSLRGDDAGWPASVMLAYDHQFLYLAIRCRQAPGALLRAGLRPPYPRCRSGGPRPRRPVSQPGPQFCHLRLPDDRPSRFRRQRLLGRRHLESRWFVACSSADGFWTAEAAIPCTVTAEPPKPNSVWAIGVQRIVPGVGFQSWNQPAAINVMPEGFGYLLFR